MTPIICSSFGELQYEKIYFFQNNLEFKTTTLNMSNVFTKVIIPLLKKNWYGKKEILFCEQTIPSRYFVFFVYDLRKGPKKNHLICEHAHTKGGGGFGANTHTSLGFFACSKPTCLAPGSPKTNFVFTPSSTFYIFSELFDHLNNTMGICANLLDFILTCISFWGNFKISVRVKA